MAHVFRLVLLGAGLFAAIALLVYFATRPLAVRITHALFDLDGTLIDTESCYKEAANRVTSRYGRNFTWADKSRLMKSNLRVGSQLIVDEFRLPINASEFYGAVMKEFESLIKTVGFMPGAVEIVEMFHRRNIPLGICTGSSREQFLMKTEHFGDFFSRNFELIVTAKDDPEIKHGKPDPEPYLVAMRRFNVTNPAAVLVFEDSEDGVRSAMGAGAKCVLVPDRRVDNSGAESMATLVIRSLGSFDPKLFAIK